MGGSKASSERKPARRGEKAEQRLHLALTRFPSQPDDALIDVRVVAALLGRSTASVWRDLSRGRLPQPQRIGVGSTRWRVGNVRAALRSRGGNVVDRA
jgi:predicted DNA-binding transcriptional regulator AlpA